MPQLFWIILACALTAATSVLIALFVSKRCKRLKRESQSLAFKKLVLHVRSTMVEENEYELIKTDKGLRISNYFGNWWNEDDADRSRKNCLAKRRGGSLELYNALLKDLDRLGIASWNGFNETDPNVSDGGGFWLEIELENGELISACGTNAYPPNYYEFIEIVRGLFSERKNS